MSAVVHVPRPRYVPTAVATQYTGKTRWVLLRAVEAGLLAPPVGKRGRSLIWELDALDRWMSCTTTGAIATPEVARRRAKPDQDAALERIRRVAQHGKAV